MKYWCLLLLTVASTVAFAQSPIGRVIGYYDKNWNVVSDTSSAAYFRTVKEDVPFYVVRNYYISGKLQMEAWCDTYQPEIKYNGKKTVYYENGVVKEEGIYKKNALAGMFRSYYEDG